ncbi:Ubiquitin Carboxyl-Terminal Hydrolase 13 [Manis pentadactyla]|nr:Ubiquitin Carboxyl-Terminal Hydrolase 13 [Manis pentadactyla]
MPMGRRRRNWYRNTSDSTGHSMPRALPSAVGTFSPDSSTVTQVQKKNPRLNSWDSPPAYEAAKQQIQDHSLDPLGLASLPKRPVPPVFRLCTVTSCELVVL